MSEETIYRNAYLYLLGRQYNFRKALALSPDNEAAKELFDNASKEVDEMREILISKGYVRVRK